MDLVKNIADQISMVEKALADKVGGTWTADEVTIIGQIRVTNEKGETTTVGSEVGVLKDFRTDNPILMKKVDQAEFAKRMQATSRKAPAPVPTPVPAAQS
jgi:hypothetical protein